MLRMFHREKWQRACQRRLDVSEFGRAGTTGIRKEAVKLGLTLWDDDSKVSIARAYEFERVEVLSGFESRFRLG